MKEVNAVSLRQSVSKIAAALERTGEPIMLKIANRQVGVIVSLKDFRERFVLMNAEHERLAILDEIERDQVKSPVSVDTALRQIRK